MKSGKEFSYWFEDLHLNLPKLATENSLHFSLQYAPRSVFARRLPINHHVNLFTPAAGIARRNFKRILITKYHLAADALSNSGT